MSDEDFRVAQLSLAGYKCSHIMVQIGIEAQGMANPQLLRAMSGLAGGMGSGLACGALSGGCCLIGLYAGMGGEGRTDHPLLQHMLNEYVTWFRDTFIPRYRGIDCADITHGNPQVRVERCPALIAAAALKARQILEANGFELDGVSGVEQG